MGRSLSRLFRVTNFVEQRTVSLKCAIGSINSLLIGNGHPTKLLDNQVPFRFRSQCRSVGDFLDSFTSELSSFSRYHQILLLSLRDFMSQSSCETGAKKQPGRGSRRVCVSNNLSSEPLDPPKEGFEPLSEGCFGAQKSHS